MPCVDCGTTGKLCGPNVQDERDCPDGMEGPKARCPEGWCWLHHDEINGVEVSVWKSTVHAGRYYYGTYHPSDKGCRCKKDCKGDEGEPI